MKQSIPWSEPYTTDDTLHGTTSVHVSRQGSVDIHFGKSNTVLASNNNHRSSTVVGVSSKLKSTTSPTRSRRTKHSSDRATHQAVSSKTLSHNQRWIIQRIVGGLSAPDVLTAAQVNRQWNRVVDSHFRLWHRLATFYSPKDAERVQVDLDIAAERRQLIQVLTESCDFLRGVGAPRTAVLSHLRGSSKRLPPSVKLIARLVQLLLTPWHPVPTSYGHQDHFFENITALLNDLPTTHSLLLSAHRAFASRKSMILALPRKSLEEVLKLSKRRQLLAPARVAAPYRQLCEWTRAMLNCVRAGNQWRLFVVNNFKRPVLGALRRHAGYSMLSSSSSLLHLPAELLHSSPPPPPPLSPPPPPPEPLPSQEMLAGYANTNYQYYAAASSSASGGQGRRQNHLSSSPSTTSRIESLDTLRDLTVEEEYELHEKSMDVDMNLSDPVERAMLQLLSVIESGRTLYGKATGSPSGLFDAIDRDDHGFVTRGQIKAALHRLSVNLTEESFREVTTLLTQEDRTAGRSSVVISKDSFTNGIVRLSWKLRPLSVMSRKVSWRLAGEMAADRDSRSSEHGGGGARQPPKMSRRVWQAYKPLFHQLREAAKRSRHLFGHVIHRMRDYFVAIDIDGDGCITNDEFRAALKRLDMGSFMTTEEIDEVFDALDQDHNGTIDRNEFETAMQAAMTMNEKELYRDYIRQSLDVEEGDSKQTQQTQQTQRTQRNQRNQRNQRRESPRENQIAGKGSDNRRPQKVSPAKIKPSPSKVNDAAPLFISVTRRRSLFDHESAFTIHNAKSGNFSNCQSPPHPAMILSHKKASHSRNTKKGSKPSPKTGIQSKNISQSKEHHHYHQEVRQQNRSPPKTRRRRDARSPSPKRGTSPNRNKTSPIDHHLAPHNEKGSIAQQRIYTRLEELRVEHEERLADVEKRNKVKMKQLSHRVEKSNEHHHADLERAMDEMDDMRQRLMQAHERTQETVNARADQQIADMEREKIAMEAHYVEEIRRLEDERITLAEAAGEVSILRRQLFEERSAYQTLEHEHAEEISHLLHERRVAEKVSRC